MNQYLMQKALRCRNGRVAIVTGRDRQAFGTLRELSLDRDGGTVPKGPKVILHMIPELALKQPFERLEGPHYLTADQLGYRLESQETLPQLRPLSKPRLEIRNRYLSSQGIRYEFDGPAYLEVFNTGLIESVDYGTLIDAERNFLSLDDLFEACPAAVERFLQVLGELGYRTTTYLFLTLTDVRGIKYETSGHRISFFKDQDCVAGPQVYVYGSTPDSDVPANNLVLELGGCAEEGP